MLSSEEDTSRSAISVNPDDVVPSLRWEVHVETEQDAVLFELGDTEFRFEGVPVESLLRVVSLLDGRRTVRAVAEAAGANVGLATAIVKQLLNFDLVVDFNAVSDEAVAPQVLFSLCRRLFPSWKDRLFRHPLWQSLTSGQASESQFTGWLLESYHFIRGVNDRLALAIAECTDSTMRDVFAHHYVEEYDHWHFFMSALNAHGLSPDVVMASRPLPGTLAVLNHMRNCARHDPLDYAICSGFLESTGADRANAFAFFEQLEKHYAANQPEIVQPMVSHLRLDEEYGHGDLLEAICSQIDPLPRKRASEALLAGAILTETLELWSTDIMRTYSEPNSVPRLSLHNYRPSPFLQNPIEQTEYGQGNV